MAVTPDRLSEGRHSGEAERRPSPRGGCLMAVTPRKPSEGRHPWEAEHLFWTLQPFGDTLTLF